MQDEQVDRDGQPEIQATPLSTPPPAPGVPGTSRGMSTWPVVLGIIAGVFGLLGFFSNMLGAISPLIMRGLMPSIAGEMSGEAEETVRATMEITRTWSSWSIGFGLIGVIVSGMLLVGGIMLLMRRAAAVPLLKAWAVARIVTAIVGAYVGLVIQRQVFEALRSTMGAEMNHVPAGLIGAATAFGTIYGVVFGCALPVIVLIWFARQKVKDEVDAWM